jgi:DNA-directed RNA polymerase sigma subunit (sigma70/sigma32)
MPNYGEYTYTEIAKELGVSRERVRQIERKALKKLASRFRQLGYDEAFLRDIEAMASYTELNVYWSQKV